MTYSSGVVIIIPDKMTISVVSWHQMDTGLTQSINQYSFNKEHGRTHAQATRNTIIQCLEYTEVTGEMSVSSNNCNVVRRNMQRYRQHTSNDKKR